MSIKLSVQSLEDLKVQKTTGKLDIVYAFHAYPFTIGMTVVVNAIHDVTQENYDKIPEELANVFKVVHNLESILKTVCRKAREDMVPEWLDKSTTVEDLGKSIQRIHIHSGLSEVARSKYRSEKNVLLIIDGEEFYAGHGADVLITNGSVAAVEIGGGLL